MRIGIALLLVLMLAVVWAAVPAKAAGDMDGSTPMTVTTTTTVETVATDVNVFHQTEVNETTVSVTTDVEANKEIKQVPLEVQVDKEINNQEMNRIQSMVREMVEKNVPVMEKNGYILERRGGTIVVKEMKGQKEKAVEIRKEIVEKLSNKLGMEINMVALEEKGHWKEVIRVENKIMAKVAKVEKNAGVLVAKEVVFDEENNVVEANVAVAAEVNGVFLVEENIPKGAEIDVNADYIVVNFDPIIAWVVELNEGEVATVNYRVRSSVPPELAPTVERLASCDVKVVVSKVVEKGQEISGQFQILLGGTPVYTKDIKVNGEWSFVKDGMYYVFQGTKPITIEGKVGECSFYKEIGEAEKGTVVQQVLLAVVLLGLVVAAYLFFRG